MDAFSSQRFELQLPWMLRDIMAKRPVAYVPLGTYEWHGEHLPLGLDALTAHGICLRAAAMDGGLVLPAMHYGCGGGHGEYPWTVIPSDPDHIAALLNFTLQRLDTNGVKLAVLFSGHFAPTQLDMIDRIANEWNARSQSMRVFATAVNRIEGLSLGPDHAGIFETTLLAALWPELVQLDRLAALNDAPLAEGDIWEEGRHDPAHPIWGVVGPDPRHFKMEQAKPLLDATVEWIASQVRRLHPQHQSSQKRIDPPLDRT
jgi:creatinine amidohydrolase